MADKGIIAFCAKHNGSFLEIASMPFWWTLVWGFLSEGMRLRQRFWTQSAL
jgi:hypothetical protein